MRFAPRAHVGSLPALEDASRDALAALLVDVLRRYDHLWTGRPPVERRTDAASRTCCGSTKRRPRVATSTTCTRHVAPPLRAPGVARYVASGELGSGTLSNPVVPEDAARALRDALMTSSGRPRRVNLIGGQVDYHEGLVVAMAIDRDVFVARHCSHRRPHRGDVA